MFVYVVRHDLALLDKGTGMLVTCTKFRFRPGESWACGSWVTSFDFRALLQTNGKMCVTTLEVGVKPERREVLVEVGVMVRFSSDARYELSEPLVFPQLTPYFPTCGSDCIRHKGTVVLCPQTGVPFPLDNSKCPVTSTR